MGFFFFVLLYFLCYLFFSFLLHHLFLLCFLLHHLFLPCFFLFFFFSLLLLLLLLLLLGYLHIQPLLLLLLWLLLWLGGLLFHKTLYIHIGSLLGRIAQIIVYQSRHIRHGYNTHITDKLHRTFRCLQIMHANTQFLTDNVDCT